MNIKTRAQFNKLLKALKSTSDQYSRKVFDTETNGLYPYRGNFMISLSIYFPDSPKKELYNVAFRHGEGEVEIKWTDKYPEGTSFNDLTWQGKAKKQWYLGYWFELFRRDKLAEDNNYFGNLPIEWLEELKAVWGKGSYIAHNSRFDAHVLYAAGFPDMEMVYDTMIGLHIVNEDWRHIQVQAPYTYTRDTAPTKSMIGMWAVDDKGELLRKLQFGNRQLKWQSAFHGFTGATAGETELFTARRAFESQLVDYIMENIYDPINEPLLLARVKNGKATEEDWVKQREKIAAKVEVDDKAHLWMLPSDLVTNYAELDVTLAWELFVWCNTIIAQWHNEDLFEKQSRIHHFVAWEMERNGFRLDIEAAQNQIALLEPRMNEIKDTLRRIADEWNINDFNPNSYTQLLKFLNSGVLGANYGTDLFPEWWDAELALELKVYPDVRVTGSDLSDDDEDALHSTGKKELERVADHPVVRLLKEMRKMGMSINTYLRKWIGAADANGIVRFSINDDGTVAGRASSSGEAGNGQNIPDRGGYTIKKAIVPYSDEWVFFAADYGQLELRLGAWIGEGLLGLDPNMTMTNLFLSGEDMHSYTRDMIDVRGILFSGLTDEQICTKLGYKPDQIDAKGGAESIVANHCRQVAKTMNFGLLYSGGSRMLSNLLRLEEAPAKVLVKKWRTLFPAFPLTQEYITDAVTERRLRPDGRGYGMYYTQPISGRHRKIHLYQTDAVYVEDGTVRHYNPREVAARKVWNNTDQGLGGYICMSSADNIYARYGRDNLRLFANIHDALEGFIHRDSLWMLAEIGTIMTDWPDIVPALTVDLQGSQDGTWQGISKIKNMPLWISSGGKEGY